MHDFTFVKNNGVILFFFFKLKLYNDSEKNIYFRSLKMKDFVDLPKKARQTS